MPNGFFRRHSRRAAESNVWCEKEKGKKGKKKRKERMSHRPLLSLPFTLLVRNTKEMRAPSVILTTSSAACSGSGERRERTPDSTLQRICLFLVQQLDIFFFLDFSLSSSVWYTNKAVNPDGMLRWSSSSVAHLYHSCTAVLRLSGIFLEERNS